MRLRFLRPVVACALPLAFVAMPTAAQVAPIGPGQTVNGRLDVGDERLADDSYFDVYEYRGRPGEAIVVTMRSSDFDAYLHGGSASETGVDMEDENDDGAGGTDARLTVTIGPTGLYRIRANSYEGGETGAYTLHLQLDIAASSGGALR